MPNIVHHFNYSTFPKPSFTPLIATWFGIPASIIILITVVGNLMVLLFKPRIGKRQTTLLIWNLALADFLVGIVVLPLGAANIVNSQIWPFSRQLCQIWISCDVIFCTASIVTLCVISIDRYIGVTKPLRYKQIVTKRKVIVSIVLIWMFSIALLLSTVRYHDRSSNHSEACLVHEELNYVVHSVVGSFFVPAIITLVLYWKIYKVAKQREHYLKQGIPITFGDNFLSSCLATTLRIHYGKDKIQKQQKMLKMHRTVAKTLGVVVSAFLICWLPFFTSFIINYQCLCLPDVMLDILTWIGYLNSMINPVIYAFTVHEFKDTLRHIRFYFCRRLLRLHQNGPYVLGDESSPIVLPRCQRAYSINCDRSQRGTRRRQMTLLSFPSFKQPKTASGSSDRHHALDEAQRLVELDKPPISIDCQPPLFLSPRNSGIFWNAKLYGMLVDDHFSEV